MSLKQRYEKEVVPALMQQLGIKNIMAVPCVKKITLNMGVGNQDKKVLNNALKELTLIAGQKAVQTRARISVAGFKVREGYVIGCKVTLRGERMYDFLERLISVVLPRIRDFRGLKPNAFDGQGNYNLGISDQLVFPEIDYEKLVQTQGLDIAITTSAKSNEHGLALLKAFNFPFKNK